MQDQWLALLMLVTSTLTCMHLSSLYQKIMITRAKKHLLHLCLFLWSRAFSEVSSTHMPSFPHNLSAVMNCSIYSGSVFLDWNGWVLRWCVFAVMVWELTGDYFRWTSQLPYKVVNPFSEDKRYLYFISDPPHLIKTARNALANGKRHLWVCIWSCWQLCVLLWLYLFS